jgi:hypothetical protein
MSRNKTQPSKRARTRICAPWGPVRSGRRQRRAWRSPASRCSSKTSTRARRTCKPAQEASSQKQPPRAREDNTAGSPSRLANIRDVCSKAQKLTLRRSSLRSVHTCRRRGGQSVIQRFLSKGGQSVIQRSQQIVCTSPRRLQHRQILNLDAADHVDVAFDNAAADRACTANAPESRLLFTNEASNPAPRSEWKKKRTGINRS